AAGTTRPPRRRPAPQPVRPAVQRVLDSMRGTPAFVLNGRLDILAANALGHALYSPIYADPIRPPHNARFTFLDPRATEFFRDWPRSPTTPSPCCAPRPPATPTTEESRI